MIMLRSIVRPEKVDNVLAALMEAGFPGVTKMSVVGRGKQRGIKIGEITYDEFGNPVKKAAIVKIEGGKIGQQGLAAAGIKQPSSGRSLQKAGKTMLAAGRDGSANRVFTDDIELQSHFHEQTFKQTCLRV